MSSKDLILSLFFALFFQQLSAQIAFEPPQLIDELNTPFEIVAGDFDGDGLNDLAYSSMLGEVRILFNDGNFNFTTEVIINSTGEYSAVPLDTADINKDGNTDLIIGVNDESENFVKVLSATGRAIQTMSIPIPFHTHEIDVLDFNQDGFLDILFSSSVSQVLEGSANGFTLHSLGDIYLTHTAAGDINNDGKMDIVGLYMSHGQQLLTCAVYKANESGSFETPPVNFDLSFGSVGRIELRDMTGDGSLDILFHVEKSTEITFFVNDGQGGFSPSSIPLPLESSSYWTPGNFSIIDLDGDHDNDVVFNSQASTHSLINVDGSNFTSTTIIDDRLARFYDIAVADITGDDSPELIALSHHSKILQIFTLQEGTFTFSKTVYLGPAPFSGAVADLNGDHSPEIIYNGNFVVSVRSKEKTQNYFGYVANEFRFADFNSDGNQDIVFGGSKLTSIANNSLNLGYSLAVLFSNDDGTTNDTPLDLISGGQADIADFNGDGHMDIASGNVIHDGNGAGQFTPRYLDLPFGSGRVVTGDLNNDTFSDLIYLANGNKLYLGLNNGEGHFPVFTEKITEGDFQEIKIRDVNNDDYDDIIIGGYNFPPLKIFHNLGNNEFEEINIESQSFVPYGWDFADMNTDGVPDLLKINTSSLEIRAQSQGLVFGEPISIDFISNYYPSGLAVYDWNKDIQPDVVLFSPHEHPIKLLLNNFFSRPQYIPTDLNITQVTSTTARLSMNTGDGRKRLILIKEGGPITASLVDQVVYQEGDVLEDGTVVAGLIEWDDFVFFPLKPITQYHVAVFENTYTDDGKINRYSSESATISFTTKQWQSIVPVESVMMPSEGNQTVKIFATSGLPVTLEKISGNITIEGNTITILEPGLIKVLASQEGNNEFDPIQVPFFFCALPATPNISKEEIKPQLVVKLSSSSSTNNEWYLNGCRIEDATDIAYHPSVNGTYHVSVNYGGCDSASEPITISDLVVEPEHQQLDVFIGTRSATDVVLEIFTTENVKRFVVLRKGEMAIDPIEDDQISFAGNLNFEEAGELENGSRLIYVGLSSFIHITDLESGTAYSGAVFQVNVDATGTIYNFHPQASKFSFKTKLTQSFNAIDDIVYDPTTEQMIPVTSTSSLPVTLEIIKGYVTIKESGLLVNAPGPVEFVARQLGDEDYAAIEPTKLAFCVNPMVPTIESSPDNSGEIVLTSSSLTHNQWFFNGEIIENAIKNTLEVSSNGAYHVVVDAEGCTSASEPFVLLITSLDEKQSALVTAFPNPVTDKLTIILQASKFTSAVISDISGKNHHAPYEQHESFIEMDFTGFTEGLYIVTVATDSGTHRMKILKQ